MATLNPAVPVLCPDLSADAVKEIIETDLTDSQINNFINAAYYMALPLTGKLAACGGVNAQCEIIKTLAAHFLTTMPSGGAVKSQSVGGEWTVTFLTEGGKGLNASAFGQAAKEMDCSGTLATLGLKRAFFEVADYAEIEDISG